MAKDKKFRFSIGLQLYVILGVFVALIMLTSLLGRVSLLQMNDIQKNITEHHIPELSIAIGMGQESVALANIASRLRSAPSEDEVRKIRTTVDTHAQRLDDGLQKLEKISFDTDTNIAVLAKFKGFAKDLLNNLALLEKSVYTTLDIRSQVKETTEKGLQEARALDNFLLMGIDNQTFFLNTGWKTLTQKQPVTPARRLRGDAVDYYRSLMTLRSQSQKAANLLSETVQVSSGDLIQPLRERFRAAVDTCAHMLSQITDKELQQKARERYEVIRTLGLGSANKSSDSDGGLFQMMETVFQEEARQSTYLAGNNSIVGGLSQQTDTLISAIQNASSGTSDAFADAITHRRNEFFALNIISVIIAILVGNFLVRKNLIGRIKSLSSTMITMSQGNLRTPLTIRGNDEITDMSRSLEVFRQHAYEAQKLELVERLAKENQEKNVELESTILKLRNAQQQMIMQEKLASLGQLTSGIAHEIKNPLNFITNFSLVSRELLEDISREVADIGDKMPSDNKSFIEEVLRDLYGNMEKINFHGQRANDIVKGMLQHSRGGDSGATEEIVFSRFLDSTINLAYQGKRTSSKEFNVDIKKTYDEQIDKVKINPQDISRVILNLVTNACDAVDEKRIKGGKDDYQPTIWIETKKIGNDSNPMVEIKVRDNGPGIPENLAQKVFDPFFTTKPTDKGTGLGLSLSHDIIAKHRGMLKLQRLEEGTEFIIELPMNGESELAEQQNSA